MNKVKWKTARSLGLNLKVLFSKKEIDKFIKKLIKLNNEVSNKKSDPLIGSPLCK